MTNEQLLEQITELTDRFTRKIPQTPEYKNRLAEEIDLIIELRFTKHTIKCWPKTYIGYPFFSKIITINFYCIDTGLRYYIIV